MTASTALAAHVRAELLANVSGVQPGKPFWLGVRLSIDSGWHVYWKNSGDAGLPTRVKFTLPDGFTAGPLQYPTPHRFDQAGGIVAFGYENSVVLLTQVTPPANLPVDFRGDFGAAVSWLVCSDVCIPGKQSANLSLGVSPSMLPANQDIFQEWMDQLPVNASDCPDVANVNPREQNPGKFVVAITWKRTAPSSVDFLPDNLADYNITKTQVQSDGNATLIFFSIQALAGKSPGATTLQAVVGYQTGEGKRRGINVSVALPPMEANNH